MIALNAPSFSPSGPNLVSQYVVDFNKDTSFIGETSGTWQGDRKKALSIYIDNYDNGIAINVSLGSNSIAVPPYSGGYLDLLNADSFVLSSVGAAIINVTLSTERKSSSAFDTRGNAPTSIANNPLTFAGNISITSSNIPTCVAYSSINNCLYFYSSNGNIVIFDCAKKVIKTSIRPSASYYGKSSVVVNGKIYFGCNSGFICIVDPVTNTWIFKDLTAVIPASAGGDILAIAYHQAENYLYLSANALNATYRIPLDFSSNATKCNKADSGSYLQVGTLFYSKVSNRMIANPLSSSQFYVISGGVIETSVRVASLSGTGPFFDGFAFDDVNNIIYGFYSNSAGHNGLYVNDASNIVANSVSGVNYTLNTSVTGAPLTNGAVVNGNQIYCANGGVYDSILLGVLGQVKNIDGSSMTGGAYRVSASPIDGYTYYFMSDATIRWVKA